MGSGMQPSSGEPWPGRVANSIRANIHVVLYVAGGSFVVFFALDMWGVYSGEEVFAGIRDASPLAKVLWVSLYAAGSTLLLIVGGPIVLVACWLASHAGARVLSLLVSLLPADPVWEDPDLAGSPGEVPTPLSRIKEDMERLEAGMESQRDRDTAV